MKPLLLLIFVALSACIRNDTASVNFIKSVFHKKGIIYTDSAGGFAIYTMKKDFNEQLTAPWCINDPHSWVHALRFTKAEIVYINDQINLSGHYAWRKGLVERAVEIPQDTINKIFTRQDVLGWSYFHQHFGKSFYTFSKPIFLRNNSVCLFYYSNNYGGLCGEGSFDIYVKRQGTWVKTYNISNWVS